MSFSLLSTVYNSVSPLFSRILTRWKVKSISNELISTSSRTSSSGLYIASNITYAIITFVLWLLFTEIKCHFWTVLWNPTGFPLTRILFYLRIYHPAFKGLTGHVILSELKERERARIRMTLFIKGKRDHLMWWIRIKNGIS